MEWTSPRIAISAIPDLSDTRLYLAVVEALAVERELLWAWNLAATYGGIDAAFRDPPTPARWARMACTPVAQLVLLLDELVRRGLLTDTYGIPAGRLKLASLDHATTYAALLRQAGPPALDQTRLFSHEEDAQ